MKTALREIGNSKGAVFPAQLIKALGLDVGDELDATTENGRLIFTPVRRLKPKYNLDQLLAECDPTAPVPADLAAWEQLESVGQEVA